MNEPKLDLRVDHDKVLCGRPGCARVWLRDGGVCWGMGKPHQLDPTVDWHPDHIVPFSKGGRTTLENLRVSCPRHNLERGNRAQSAEAASYRPGPLPVTRDVSAV
jgi:5-methylcytosine-specific restriction endonuclease McrA